MRLLKAFQDRALADFGDQRFLGRQIPEFALEVVGGFASPQSDHVVDAFEEHRLAIAAKVLEHLHVGRQAARADADNQAAFEQVVEHRHVGGKGGGVAIRQIQRAGAKRDVLGVVHQARQKHQAGRDRFGQIGGVLTDKGFGKAEPVGQQNRFAVFLQRFQIVAPGRVQGHGEVAEFHWYTPCTLIINL